MLTTKETLNVTTPSRIVVTEGLCHHCSAHAFHVHHQSFPELRLEGATVEEALGLLIERLQVSLDSVADPAHRDMVQAALADLHQFQEGLREHG